MADKLASLLSGGKPLFGREIAMTYKQALEYIHSVSWMGSRPGLSRTRELLARMGNPQDKLRFIHVAGTNGKGSVCAMLASVLKAAGYKTGMYTSPYIIRFNDRMRINGEDISDDELAEITEYVKQYAEAMEDHPTEFELVTAIGFEYFKRQRCDVVVLEVGMGGELDSTNVIKKPIVSVITPLALDHTAVLGSTIEEIAKAKAGIIKEGCPVVSADNTVEGAAVIKDACRALGCSCRSLAGNWHADDWCFFEQDSYSMLSGITFNYKGEDYSVPLKGVYQFCNAALVMEVIEVLKEQGFDISTTAVKQGLSTVYWPARFELIRQDPLFIYDGGHNPQGVKAAVDTYKFCVNKAVVLIGVMADKDYTVELEMLMEIADSFITVTPNNPRSLSAKDLAGAIEKLGGVATAADTVEQGVQMALATGKNVLATGSLYMYEEVKKAVDKLLPKE